MIYKVTLRFKKEKDPLSDILVEAKDIVQAIGKAETQMSAEYDTKVVACAATETNEKYIP